MSSYLVLARKYRPTTFDEVIGQEVVTSVLSGALQEGRIGHAYLFAGPRGTGKTTTARVLAKCLNCEQGPTPKPCGTCERCVAAEEGAEVDIIEIDAASHTGVDNVRDLRDEAIYAPMRARYKVYIVDEVHMLSKAAFNALLKILEEPPAHVVFLFATTEPHKVLDTILSRCQVLRLSPLTEEQIVARLEDVFQREGVHVGEGVTRELARSARGGMRDALSMADKLLALAGNQPTLEDLSRLGGEGGAREIEELLAQVEAGDKGGLLNALGRFIGDESELLAGLLETLRTCVLLAHCGAETPIVMASEEERRRAVERATRLGAERIELWMQELLHARERMRVIPGQERLILEVTLLDLCRPEATLPLGELIQRLERLEGDVPARAPDVPARAPAPASSGPAPARAPAAPAPARPPAGAAPARPPAGAAPVRPPAGAAPVRPPAGAAPVPQKTVPAPPRPASASPAASPAKAGPLASLWNPFLDELRRTHGALATMLEQRGSPASLEEAGAAAVAIRLASVDPDEAKLVGDRRNRVACSRAFSRVGGRTLEVRVLLPEDEAPAAASAAGEPAAGAASGASEGNGSERRPEGRKAGRDEFTQGVADLFGGVIEDVK